MLVPTEKRKQTRGEIPGKKWFLFPPSLFPKKASCISGWILPSLRCSYLRSLPSNWVLTLLCPLLCPRFASPWPFMEHSPWLWAQGFLSWQSWVFRRGEQGAGPGWHCWEHSFHPMGIWEWALTGLGSFFLGCGWLVGVFLVFLVCLWLPKPGLPVKPAFLTC